MNDLAFGSSASSALESQSANDSGEPTLAELDQRLATLRENIRRAREQYGLPPVDSAADVGPARRRA